MTYPSLLDRIEDYYDAVPRSSARAEDLDPFTLFVAERGWPFYARPRRGRSGPVTATDVERVLDRQRQLGVPRSFEWVEDLDPEVSTACVDAGLVVTRHPLLVHHDPLAVPVPDGVRLRRIEAADPAVAGARVVADLGFSASGTRVGEAGAEERDARLRSRDPDEDEATRDRIGRRLTVLVVAEDEGGVVATGSHNPLGEVTEIVGVATLPAFRRQGLGAAVTDTLVADAIRRGQQIVFLTAGDDDVARVYERVGFRRVATAGIAAAAD